MKAFLRQETKNLLVDHHLVHDVKVQLAANSASDLTVAGLLLGASQALGVATRKADWDLLFLVERPLALATPEDAADVELLLALVLRLKLALHALK